MSQKLIRPGVAAAMAAVRGLYAAGWRSGGVTDWTDGSRRYDMIHPSGRELAATVAKDGDTTDLILTGLTMEQAAGAVTGADLTTPTPGDTTCLACGHAADEHVEDGIGCRADRGFEICGCPFHRPAKANPADDRKPCTHCGGTNIDSTRHGDVTEDHPCGYCQGGTVPVGPNAALVAGLRALADFYETHPTMPMPLYPKFGVTCSNLTDGGDAAAELVRHAAELLGTEITQSHGHTRTKRMFGVVEFKAYASNVKADGSAR